MRRPSLDVSQAPPEPIVEFPELIDARSFNIRDLEESFSALVKTLKDFDQFVTESLRNEHDTPVTKPAASSMALSEIRPSMNLSDILHFAKTFCRHAKKELRAALIHSERLVQRLQETDDNSENMFAGIDMSQAGKSDSGRKLLAEISHLRDRLQECELIIDGQDEAAKNHRQAFLNAQEEISTLKLQFEGFIGLVPLEIPNIDAPNKNTYNPISLATQTFQILIEDGTETDEPTDEQNDPPKHISCKSLSSETFQDLIIDSEAFIQMQSSLFDVENQNQILNRQLDQKEEEISDIKHALDDLEVEFGKSQSIIYMLQTNLETSTEVNTRLTTQGEALQSEVQQLKRLKAEKDMRMDQEISDIQKDSEAKSRKIEEFTKIISQFEIEKQKNLEISHKFRVNLNPRETPNHQKRLLSSQAPHPEPSDPLHISTLKRQLANALRIFTEVRASLNKRKTILSEMRNQKSNRSQMLRGNETVHSSHGDSVAELEEDLEALFGLEAELLISSVDKNVSEWSDDCLFKISRAESEMIFERIKEFFASADFQSESEIHNRKENDLKLFEEALIEKQSELEIEKTEFDSERRNFQVWVSQVHFDVKKQFDALASQRRQFEEESEIILRNFHSDRTQLETELGEKLKSHAQETIELKSTYNRLFADLEIAIASAQQNARNFQEQKQRLGEEWAAIFAEAQNIDKQKEEISEKQNLTDQLFQEFNDERNLLQEQQHNLEIATQNLHDQIANFELQKEELATEYATRSPQSNADDEPERPHEHEDDSNDFWDDAQHAESKLMERRNSFKTSKLPKTPELAENLEIPADHLLRKSVVEHFFLSPEATRSRPPEEDGDDLIDFVPNFPNAHHPDQSIETSDKQNFEEERERVDSERRALETARDDFEKEKLGFEEEKRKFENRETALEAEALKVMEEFEKLKIQASNNSNERADLHKFEEQISEREADLIEQLQNLEISRSQLETAIQEYETHRAEIDTKKGDIESRERLLHERESELTKRGIAITEKEAQYAGEVAEFERLIEHKFSEISETEKQLRVREQQLEMEISRFQNSKENVIAHSIDQKEAKLRVAEAIRKVQSLTIANDSIRKQALEILHNFDEKPFRAVPKLIPGFEERNLEISSLGNGEFAIAGSGVARSEKNLEISSQKIPCSWFTFRILKFGNCFSLGIAAGNAVSRVDVKTGRWVDCDGKEFSPALSNPGYKAPNPGSSVALALTASNPPSFGKPETSESVSITIWLYIDNQLVSRYPNALRISNRSEVHALVALRDSEVVYLAQSPPPVRSTSRSNSPKVTRIDEYAADDELSVISGASSIYLPAKNLRARPLRESNLDAFLNN